MTDLFEKKEEANQAVETPPVVPNTDQTDLLAVIKNERGEQKFKSVEDLIKGYNTSQEFIGTLKDEKTAVETSLQESSAKVKSQEQLEELLKTKTETTTLEAVPEGMKAEDVVKILEQREVQKVADANVILVRDAVKGAKGDMNELVKDAGLSPEIAQQLAQSSPEALLKLLGVKDTATPPPSMEGSVHSNSFHQNQQPDVKRVMRSSKSSDLTAAWKAAGTRSEAKLVEQGLP